MKSMIKNSTLTLLLFFLFFGVNAQIPPRPNPPKLVNDFANLLSQEGRNYLERKLVNFDDSTSVQICIVTTFSLGEYGIDQFADELGAKWGVGAKGKDNGIIIVVKPKSKDAKGQARISVGYGLEGVIPDATAGQIVDYEMIPQFNNNKYFDGLDNATNSIIKFASGEYKPGMYKKKFEKKSSWLYLIPIIVIIIIILLMKASSRKRGTNISSRGSNDSLFWILTALFMGGGGRGGGGFGGGGGSSGGDFGGFGGGDFGGGGASGDW